jgi:K(+)-stimulated pyrophosphate-energized sodium pump
MSGIIGFTDWAWVLGLVGLLVALGIFGYVKRQPSGTDIMRDLEEQIHDGAMAFLKRQYTFLFFFVVVVAILLGWAISLQTAIAYIAGASCSAVAGFIGMTAATRANVRTAQAANQDGAGKALRVAFFGGAVMGLAVASVGLLGIGIFYVIYAAGAIPGTDDLADLRPDHLRLCHGSQLHRPLRSCGWGDLHQGRRRRGRSGGQG